MADPLADHAWNKQNPGWLRATVWAAQHAESTSSCGGRIPHDDRRCAACAAENPDAQRCSKCRLVRSIQPLLRFIPLRQAKLAFASIQVFFCNRECQLAAHSVHKHYCTQPQFRQYATSLKVPGRIRALWYSDCLR